MKNFETKLNLLDPLNGTFRYMRKVLWSLESSKGAQEFAEGLRTYYNTLHPHKGINGMKPAQMENNPHQSDEESLGDNDRVGCTIIFSLIIIRGGILEVEVM